MALIVNCYRWFSQFEHRIFCFGSIQGRSPTLIIWLEEGGGYQNFLTPECVRNEIMSTDKSDWQTPPPLQTASCMLAWLYWYLYVMNSNWGNWDFPPLLVALPSQCFLWIYYNVLWQLSWCFEGTKNYNLLNKSSVSLLCFKCKQKNTAACVRECDWCGKHYTALNEILQKHVNSTLILFEQITVS